MNIKYAICEVLLMTTTVLFDLDGTLLPMDQDLFLKSYMAGLAAKVVPHGYDPDALVKTIWKGTGCMIMNDGSASNETTFWKFFASVYGEDKLADRPIFEDFYRNEFQNVAKSCGFDTRANEAIQEIKAMGFRLALATNPLFPAIATHSRARWAGLNPEDFALITTYENSRFCKPNPAYYRDVMNTLGVSAQECVMVGNDVVEDMVAAKLGMRVFLLTDCLINKNHEDITVYPHGSFPELLEFIRGLDR